MGGTMENPLVYAVKHKEESVRMASRSGGIFTAISDIVLREGGVVYGCALDRKFRASHIARKQKRSGIGCAALNMYRVIWRIP